MDASVRASYEDGWLADRAMDTLTIGHEDPIRLLLRKTAELARDGIPVESMQVLLAMATGMPVDLSLLPTDMH